MKRTHIKKGRCYRLGKGMVSTVYYDLTDAPKTAMAYCKPCGAELLAGLVEVLA